MIIPNNFKEIRITPNEDDTFKITYYDVMFQDINRKQLEPAIVTYPRVKINSTELWFNPFRQNINIEILPDDSKDKNLQIVYIPEEE